MQRENLLETLGKYEDFRDIKISARINDVQTIINDINRSDFGFSKISKTPIKVKIYLHILRISFKSLPISYYQGMTEVAVVILDAYFQEALEELKGEERRDGEAHKTIKLDDISSKEISIFNKFLEKHSDLYSKYKNAMVNVLNERFLQLTRDNFKIYSEFNTKFVLMINSGHIDALRLGDAKVTEMNSFRFMNHTLTFFKRLAGNSEVVYTIFNLILNSDPSMIFCILGYYLEKASQFTGSNIKITNQNKSKYLIYEVSETDLKKILKIHDAFLKGKYLKKKATMFRGGLFFGVCLGVLVIAFAISYLNKQMA